MRAHHAGVCADTILAGTLAWAQSHHKAYPGTAHVPPRSKRRKSYFTATPRNPATQVRHCSNPKTIRGPQASTTPYHDHESKAG